MKIVDCTNSYPGSLIAQQKGSRIAVLSKLSEPYRRTDGRMTTIKVEFINDSQKTIKTSYWQQSEIRGTMSALSIGTKVNLFNRFDIGHY